MGFALALCPLLVEKYLRDDVSLLWLALLIGSMTSARVVFAPLPLLIGLLFLKKNRVLAVRFAIAATLVNGAWHGLFYAWAETYQPLHLFARGMRNVGFDLLAAGGVAAMGLAALLLRWCDDRFESRLAWFAAVLASMLGMVALGELRAVHYDPALWEGASRHAGLDICSMRGQALARAGRGAGTLPMDHDNSERRIKMTTIELQDRKEIEELLYRYAWMVDKRKWELMDDVFAPGATIDYTSTGGVHGPYRPTLEWLARALADWPLNLHAITNVVIEVDAGAVRSRCMFMAPMGRLKADGAQDVILNGGHYYDDLTRTPQGWRIARRVCEQTVMMGQLPAGYQIPQ